MFLYILIAVAISYVVYTLFLKKTDQPNLVSSQTTKTETKKPSKSAEIKLYTKEEVSKHNSEDDCWLIVNGKVYDVSSFVGNHPGGLSILNQAGRDNTEDRTSLTNELANVFLAFYGDQHPQTVHEMIDEYYIGDLK